jgi:exopolysaccharide biosynthesis protein
MTFHAARFDLQKFDLRVADARTNGRRVDVVDQLRRELNGVVAVNGSFFELQTDGSPHGWLVDRGKELSPVPSKQWYSTFVIDAAAGSSPRILDNGMPLPNAASLQFALQAGPRTVRDRLALPHDHVEAERTAICVVTQTTVILLATEGGPVSNGYLANLMARTEADGGFGCQEGMMFDGGPSTQMSIRTKSLSVDVRGGWPVPNAVVVVPLGDREERPQLEPTSPIQNRQQVTR